MSTTCLIIGAGHAADEAIQCLRRDGWTGAITLVGEEPHLPYNRPPLSKTFLAESQAPEALFFRDRSVYERAGVELILGRRAVGIDRAAHAVSLDDGGSLGYSKLLITTGARPRRIDIPGASQDELRVVRTIDDILGLRPFARAGGRVVLVGAGYIGLETAAMLRKIGASVTVLEAMPRVLARVTAPAVSAFFERVHREEGVEIVTGAGIAGASGGQVRLADGRAFAADCIVVGIGVLPNTELAEAAGLQVDRGILIDEACRTSDPDIFAAGDCTRFTSLHYGASVRLESVQNAKDQARTAAAAICGKPARYDSLPWFWSDQYDVKLQIAGLSDGHDAVALRGDPGQGRSFAAFYLKAGEIIAVDAVNRPKEFMIGKRLIAARARIAPERLADEGVAVADLR
jgi:3-phenylpropionate/trans-cinnamate dioxygenase ferredoxin reductase subunit